MESVIKLFNDFGWLSNGLGIIIPLFGGAYATYQWIWPKVKPVDPCKVILPSEKPSWLVADAKRYASIAIVDDQPQDFPIKELLAAGYKIDSFKQVQLSDVEKLSGYDVVFLDMKGIVKDDHDYGGLRLISSLREKSAIQKICAVSSKTFDPTATEFFKKADKTKRKPLTAQECASVIDEFFDELFNPQKTTPRIMAGIQALPRSAKSRLSVVAHVYLDRKDGDLLKAGLSSMQMEPVLQREIINAMRVLANANK